MNTHEQNPTEFEQRLAAWIPGAAALDRDAMLFEAGRASARAEGSSQVWRCAAAVLATVLAALGGLFAHERSQRLALETALAAQARLMAETPRQVAQPAPSLEKPGPSSYFALTARLSSGEFDLPPDPSAFHAAQPARAPRPPTLRPRGFERALDL